jgi:hypothetical protein
MLGESVYTNDPERIKILSNQNIALPNFPKANPIAIEILSDKKEFTPEDKSDVHDLTKDAYD